ncbi:MAG: NUDIX domain-containing protein [Alphaproteobacteria bacterium]
MSTPSPSRPSLSENASQSDDTTLAPLPKEVPPFYSGVILWGRSGKLLVQQRDDIPGIVNPGMVGTFGGGGHEGETPEEAAIREIKEELNIDLRAGDLIRLEDRERRFRGGVTIRIYSFGVINVSEEDIVCSEGELLRVDPDKIRDVPKITPGCLAMALQLIDHVKDTRAQHKDATA